MTTFCDVQITKATIGALGLRGSSSLLSLMAAGSGAGANLLEHEIGVTPGTHEVFELADLDLNVG